MKAAFYYSRKMLEMQQNSTHPTILTIDGLRFTESVTFEDHEEPKPCSVWDDTALVTIVEDVTLMECGGFKSLSYDSGPLKNRITFNGKIQ